MALDQEAVYEYQDALPDVLLMKVRVMNEHIHEYNTYNGESTEKYEIQIILDPTVAREKKYIDMLVAEANKHYQKINDAKMPADKCAITDGAYKTREEYHPYWLVSGKSKKQGVIRVMDGTAADPTAIVAKEDCKIKNGSICNVKLRWIILNGQQKRANLELVAIQYVGQGDTIIKPYEKPEEEYTSGFENPEIVDSDGGFDENEVSLSD